MVVRSALLVTFAVLGALGCGAQEAELDTACLSSPETYLTALEDAPRQARLPSGTSISGCASGARSDGDLQNAGVLMVKAADRLALGAQDGDATAALRLGFLAGAVEKGASTSQGIQTELARRVVRAGALLGDAPAAITDAYLEGLEAGRQRG